MMRRILIVAALTSLSSVPAAAQSFEVGAHLASAQWSEFEGSDLGVGGRFTWQPSATLGIEADLTWYPSDFPDGIAFTRRRVEGLFGATIGPRLNRVRPFAKAAAGFLEVGATRGAFACIAIFPPPLNCRLAGGGTLPAYEIGGGVAVDVTPRTFVRADISSRIVKYPGPSFDRDGGVRLEGFFGQALRVTFGGGIRF